MKALSSFIIACFVFSLGACKKNSSNNPYLQDLSKEINATITVVGSPPIFIVSSETSESFRKTINARDTTLMISGSNGSVQITIYLVNIHQSGIYEFKQNIIAGNGAECVYQVGVPNPTVVYTTIVTNTSPGTIIIETLTNNYIKGTFTANCTSASGGLAQVTNGSFKGDF
jgi:tryptophanase